MRKCLTFPHSNELEISFVLRHLVAQNYLCIRIIIWKVQQSMVAVFHEIYFPVQVELFFCKKWFWYVVVCSVENANICFWINKNSWYSRHQKVIIWIISIADMNFFLFQQTAFALNLNSFLFRKLVKFAAEQIGPVSICAVYSITIAIVLLISYDYEHTSLLKLTIGSTDNWALS